jgi:hypothetical protein
VLIEEGDDPRLHVLFISFFLGHEYMNFRAFNMGSESWFLVLFGLFVLAYNGMTPLLLEKEIV